MMEVLVINLATRPDRRAFMTERLEALGLPFRFVEAVDGRDPEANVDIGRAIGVVTGRTRSRIDFAAFSSHRLCWKIIADENIPMAVILEDDVLLVDDFDRILNPGWVPPDADLVKLETTKRYVEVHDLHFDTQIKRNLGMLAGKHMGAAGYVITHKAAERLWAKTKVPADSVDQVLFTPTTWQELGLTIYQVDPAPVVQGMYQGENAAHGWATSTIQRDRDERGYVMEIGNTRLFGHREAGLLSKLFRVKTMLHAYRAVRSLIRHGAYKRIQFG